MNPINGLKAVAYGKRSGIRYMANDLKVYCIPWVPFVIKNNVPILYGLFPLLRNILIWHEALLHARTMGYKVVFTDHSLYGFDDLENMHMNKVHFIIDGDGTRRVRLEEMREKHTLEERVEILGVVPHSRVQSILVHYHIFLNNSFTEAFCIAIVEATSSGLLTISTRVGGVPEVLPRDMIVLAEPVKR